MPEPPRTPVVGMQIKLPCATGQEFRARHGEEIASGVLFVRTRSAKPEGTLIRFDIRLSTGTSVLRGIASVKSSTSVTDSPDRPGMLLQLRGLDVGSQRLLQDIGIQSNTPTFRPAATLPPGRLTPVASAESAAPAESAAEVPSIRSDAEPAPRTDALAEAKPAPPLPPEEPSTSPAPLGTRAGPFIGIDLGSANSAVAWVRGTKAMVIPSRDGHRTIPSVFAVDENGHQLIGHAAKAQLLQNPHNTVYGAKRLLGRTFHSEIVPQLQERLPYRIVEGLKGEAAVSLGGRVISLQEITAQILRELRANAESYLGQSVSRAVITVPAHYSDVQRQAVREAGTLAGLSVEQIVSEPAAAAVSFGDGRTLQQRLLVYDLGGGTFDVSVLEMRGNNIYEVVSTGGDTFLGGVDFDLRMFALLVEKFQARHGRELANDPALVQRFLDAAEQAKLALSDSATHRVQIPFVPLEADRLIEFDTSVSRTEFEQSTADLVDRTIQLTAEVLNARQMKPTDIQEVLLVGGQTRMPLVRERLRAFFGKDPTRGAHPEEAVALGAALLAHAAESDTTSGAVLVDVLPMSIGVGLPGGRFRRIIARNTPLPHTHTYPAGGGDTELLVFQGESDRALENQYLGSVPLEVSRGRADITFRLNREAVLSVTVRNPESGEEHHLTLEAREPTEKLRAKLAEQPERPQKRGLFGRLFGKRA